MDEGARLAAVSPSPLRHQPTETTSYVEKKKELIVCSNRNMSSGLKSRPRSRSGGVPYNAGETNKKLFRSSPTLLLALRSIVNEMATTVLYTA